MRARAKPVIGLVELERRFAKWLNGADSALVVMRWEIDGRLFMRLRVHPDGNGIRYVWLDDDDPTMERREVRSFEELEELLKRQLLEPAGEDILIYWNDRSEPKTKFWAMIAVDDQLKCVWEPDDE